MRYYTVTDLREHFNWSRSWIERRLRHSNFSRPYKFGSGIGMHCRWRRDDVAAWEESYQQCNLDDLTEARHVHR
jgi:predicted DNA-binding transcriptional regulator AlpA